MTGLEKIVELDMNWGCLERNTGGLVRGRQSTFRRNNVTREKGGGSEDGVSNRLAVQQNNPRAWFNQIKEQSPLLGGRRNRNAVVALRGVTNESRHVQTRSCFDTRTGLYFALNYISHIHSKNVP